MTRTITDPSQLERLAGIAENLATVPLQGANLLGDGRWGHVELRRGTYHRAQSYCGIAYLGFRGGRGAAVGASSWLRL